MKINQILFYSLTLLFCTWIQYTEAFVPAMLPRNPRTDRYAASIDAGIETQVQEVLKVARTLGPVGSIRSPQEQKDLLKLALQLRGQCQNPARIPLTGRHNLVYSAAPGGSSGKLGPLVGRVTQEFVDDQTFVNAVQLGPLRIALRATRSIQSEDVIKVRFHQTTVSVFGQTVVQKDIGGGGTWKVVFAGTIRDTDGVRKLVRVLETPSLFVIEQPLTE